MFRAARILGEAIGDIIVKRYSRRDDDARHARRRRRGCPVRARRCLPQAAPSAEATADRFDFEEIDAGVDGEPPCRPTAIAADGAAQMGRPALSRFAGRSIRCAQSAAAQLRQFGYNNDYVAFFPLDDAGERGLLCVNHEYTNEEVMFPGIVQAPGHVWLRGYDGGASRGRDGGPRRLDS